MSKIGILEEIKKAGISDVGFCAFEQVAPFLLDCRARRRLPERAKTVICCIFPYKVHQHPPRDISRYAAVPDYHGICLPMLQSAAAALAARFPQNRFEPFCDNSPVPEVYAAACAGLGVRGDNGLLITPRFGSFVFLGEIVTDLEIPCENRFARCPGCGKCAAACPRGGLDCLSAVTQKKGELSVSERAALRENRLLWGCDRCAEVCPLNRTAACTGLDVFRAGYRDTYTENEDITGRAYAWRGEACIRRNYANLHPKPDGGEQK